VSRFRFLRAHQHSAIHVGWSAKYRTVDKLKTENTQIKYNKEQSNIQQNRHLLWHSARKWGGLVLQCYRAHTVSDN